MKTYTHSGIFHADEVLATAIIRRIAREQKESFSLQRVLEIPEDVEDDAIIFDIGGGVYDHHSRDIEYRENGVPYSSVGLIWRDFGKDYLAFQRCPQEYILSVFHEVDERFIQAVDARDNGYMEFEDAYCENNLTFSDMIANFNPAWDEAGKHVNGHSHFWRAVKFAGITFDRFVHRIISEYKARSVVLEAIAKSNGNVMILDEYAPWQKIILDEGNTRIWFVIYPSKRGGYSWQVVPVSFDDQTARCHVPEEWWGADKDTLKELSGVEDAIFCHRNGFLGSCESVEGCQRMVEKAIEQGGKR